MYASALIACLPWFGLLLVLLLVLWLLLRFCRPPISFQRLATLHTNETGGVQSLSFVATLPVFVMVIMLIVQVSQVMIANLVVQYAAFAAARSATVWLPAAVEPGMESENVIVHPWSMEIERHDWQWQGTGFFAGYSYPVYRILPAIYPDPRGGTTDSAKLARIHRAAALACMPIAPSRNPSGDAPTTPLTDSATRAYFSVSPGSAANLRVPPRIANKLAYSLENTTIEMRRTAPHDYWSWYWGDWGPTWRDQLTLTVTHQYALLPGPGRLLARSVRRGGPDPVSGRISRSGSFYTIPIQATATLPNEGETSAWRYSYPQTLVKD